MSGFELSFDGFVLAASTDSLADEHAAREHADAGEFRLDLAADPLDQLAAYDGELPLIATNRAAWEGGEATDEEARLDTLATAVDHDAEAIIRKGRELYWALMTWLDEEVGKVLAALERSAVADNTVVIYTSDHGENKGDHGMWWKNNMFEHAARVPLIFRWPGRWQGGQRRAGACSLVDLTQTIAALGGADIPGDWDGDSMVGWLDDTSFPWKDRAVSEYYAHNIASSFAMLRRGAYKYVYHTRMDENHSPERELYNLREDPKEFENLADRPEQQSRMARMHAVLVEELGRPPDEIEQQCRADYARGYEREMEDTPK